MPRVSLSLTPRLLALGALAIVVAPVSGRADVEAPQRFSLEPAVQLPDGSEFKTWVKPAMVASGCYTRTYYVDQRHAQADDDHPGTRDRPWRTIRRAAEVLRPGERVVVAAGLYRERVSPARGGTGPERMISYEAAPGAEVVVSGSRVVRGPWQLVRSPGEARADQPPVAPDGRVWKVRLDPKLFPEENPLKEVNLSDAQIDRSMPWAVPTKGSLPNLLRRGLVFQDGERLEQVPKRADLSKAHGRWWAEEDGLTLFVRPARDVDPGEAVFEVTVQGLVFAPREYGLGYIRVSGLTIQHAGNRFPRPQQGALSTQRGHHWIIEGNTVRQCNSIGIDIGDQFRIDGPELAQGGQHVVRRNTILDCGIGGLEGKLIEHALIEENVIRRCGWQDCWRIYECGGIKVHCTRSCLVRRNLVTDTISCPGIWMDYANVNSRCTGNAVLNAGGGNGAIFLEASQEPNLVDHNVVWGSKVNGIYQHDCDELVIAHNLIVHSRACGVRMQVCKGRRVGGRLSTAKRNRILGNVLLANRAPISMTDPENTCDYNVFAHAPSGDGDARPFDLAGWRERHGFDRHGVVIALSPLLDAETLRLAWKPAAFVPGCPRLPQLSHDFFGVPREGESTPAGPFADGGPWPAPRALCPWLE